MRKYLSLIWVVAAFIMLGTTAQAQTCPPVGPDIDIRFNNVRLDCANDSLFVDIELKNPTGSTYSVSSMSLRFTYNVSMLGMPHISQQIMAGSPSLALQSGIWSYGLVEFSAANAIPTGGAWTKVTTLGFHVSNFDAAGNSNCIALNWNTSLPAITTVQQWVNFACQPNMVFTSYGNNSTCIVDSCNTTSGALNLTALPTNITCTGTNNGTVNLTVTGGTAPYSYLWSNGATTENIASLPAGTYSVTVTDANSQTATIGSLVVGTSSLTVQYTVSDASCNQTDDGAINIDNVLGGTAPFTYLWSNGATTEDISLLVAGNYSVTVTDANGCQGIIKNIVIAEPDAFQYNVFINNISCAAGTDGELDFTLTGGTAPYTYLWVRYDLNNYMPIDTLGTTQDLSNLTSGLYGVEVQDANGCNGAVFFLLVEPDPLDIGGNTAYVQAVSCNGANDGAINITADGGTGVISFLWSNGAQTEDLEDLYAGVYTVTATDLNGCSITDSYTITEPDTISIAIDPNLSDSVSCYGGNNGSININVSGGNGGVTFAWSNGATTEDISGLVAGTYSVTVSDSLGCQGALANIVVGQPDSLKLTATSTTVSCNATSDGTASLTVSGGNGGYTYLWSNGATAANLTGLVSGNYTVTVTDAKSCTKSVSVTVGVANCPPLARNDINNTLKNVPVSGDISTNDSDPDGDDLTFTVITGPSNGTLTAFDPATGTYTYTPNNNFVGEDIYTYYVCDDGIPSLCDTATVYIEVLDDPKDPFNNPPVANADHFITYVNTSFGSTVINNDYDPDTADVILVNPSLVQLPSHGIFLVLPNGDFTYIPDNAFVGNDTLQYSICDNGTPGPKCDTAFVVITVLSGPGAPGNLPPVAVDDAFYTEINNPVNGTVIPNDYDTDGNQISVTVPQFSGPSHGTLTILPNGDFVYIPNNNYVGPDQFVYILCDNGVPSLCDTATAYILIQNPANQPPIARNDINNTLLNIAVSGSVATNDEEPDGDNVVFTQLTSTTNGTITGFNPTTGTYTYTPNTGFIGTDVFTYSICDDGIPSLCDSATVTIHVIPPFNHNNNPPVANPDDYVTYINTPVSGTVIPNDFDPDTADIITVGITLITPPTHGTVTSINPNGTFTYVPTNGYIGDDTFEYVLCDNGTPSLCDTALVTVHVLPPNGGGNLPPVAVDDAYITEEGVTINNTVIPNDYDQDGNTITVTVPQFTGPSHGSLTILPNGDFVYVPNPGYTGPDQFTYILCDNGVPSLCDTATAYITIYDVMRIVLTPDSVDCFGSSTGSIALTVINGNAPFTYLWSTGAITQNLTGVPAGIYSVTVTDAYGVTVAGTDTVVEPGGAIAVIETIVNPTCNGLSNATIMIAVSGGSPDYTYQWSGPFSFAATSQNIGGLPAGTYNVTVTDGNNCTYTNSYVVTEPNVLVASIDDQTNVACSGGNTGAIDLGVTGGTTAYTYLWSNGATTQDLTGLAIGTYTVTVTDAQSCTATASATITQNDALTVSATNTNVSCNGLSNGALDITATGGVIPYTYLWSNAAVTEDVTGLVAGSYTVTVTDAAGCTGTGTFTITEPATLTASATADNVVTCYGGNDGAITLTVNGGTTAYTYLWSNGAATQNLSGLIAGTYTVTVTDANSCTATASATVIENPELDVTLVGTTNVSCNGGNDGAIDVSVAGGVSPYTYAWRNGATTQDISGLVAGTYALTVTDAVGCTFIDSVTITEPNLLVATIDDQTNVACNGGNTGAIDLGVTGGTTAYTYLWSNGATTQDLTGLAIGTYTATVTDAQSCTATASATITQNDALTVSATNTNVSCNGLSNGALDITATGGVIPYTYLWSNAAVTEDVTGLAAGSYTVTVTDAAGCTGTGTFTITEPATLTASATADNVVTCYGGNDGAITLTVNGGTTAYTYLWSNGAITQNLSGLTAGTYDVTVTDANNCTATASATVTENPELVVSLNGSNDVSCNGGNDGDIDITVTGGVAPYTYTWSNGATTQDLTGLTAGTYGVTVTDANNCTATGSFTIGEPTLLVASIDGQTNVACNGGNTGEIDLGVTGGTPAYTYLWSNGATTQDLTGLAIGTYTATVTDANGCTATASATITQSPALVVDLDQVVDVTCNGLTNGSIFLNISGGTPAYTYSWSGPNGYTGSTQNISGLVAGSYSITVTDANSCTGTGTFTVNEPATLTASATADNVVTCYGGNDGAITLTVNGGTTAYTYLWSNGAITQNLSGLTAGTYNVTVTDANNCTATASATVTENPELVVSLNGSNDVSCNGGNDGDIDITVTGGVAPYTYAWSNGATTQDLTGLTAGTYGVTVTDANNCTATGSFTIGEPTLLVASIDGQTNVACNGGNTGEIDLGVTGGTPGYTYLWSNGATTQDLTGLAIGTYTATITDANGCTATASATITENDPLQITATNTTNVSCFGNADGALDITVTGGVIPYTYVWSNGATTEDVSGLVAGTYGVTVTDAAGCTGTGSFTITQPNELTIEADASNVTCDGGANGATDLLVGGGTLPYSFAWSNGATIEDLTGLSAGVYSVTVTDANGCTIGATVTVGTDNLLVLNTAVTNATCGESNGVAGVTVSGGSGSFTYAWSPTGNTASISGLAAGTYSVTVTDAVNGCTATRTLAVSGTSTLAVTPSVTNATCGGANGSISLAVTGGTPAYTYAWSNGTSGSTATGLAAGTYSVTVNDANGCPQVLVVEVDNDNNSLGLLPSSNNATCGQANGDATFSTIGGVAPFTYAWSNGSNAITATGLAAGTYFVTVTDANGCSQVASININNTNGPSVSIDNIVNVTCANGSTGSVAVIATGGTAPYTYFWSNGTTSRSANNLPAGTYTVTVTDANGCQSSLAATVGTPDAIDVIVDATQVTCNNANNGAATVRVSGGVGPYTFGWSNGATSQNLLSLAPGTYAVTVTDANGCNASTPATISEPDQLEISSVTTDVTCAGGNTGAIALTVTGGTTPYTYAWSNGASTASISGLAQGLYIVTVTDANGCTATANINVNTLNTLVLNTAATNATCGQSNGVATVSVSGGSGTFTYNWGTGNTASIGNLVPGVYSVTVTDAVNGCTATASVPVSGSSDIDVTHATVDVICGSAATGSITLGVSGGTAPYTYAWSTPLGSGTSATGLTAGTYYATVSDAAGCQEVLILDVTEIVSMRILSNVTDASCGQSNGSATLTVTSGTAPYSYVWSNGATAATASNLAAGVYFVTITDANGCSQVSNVTVGNLAGPAITIANVTNLSCANASTGSVDISITGGVGPYNYLWSNGATTEDLTSLPSGQYNVTVTDAAGCQASTFVTITTPNAIEVITEGTDVSCNNANNGATHTVATGGVGPYTYAWSNGATTADLSGLAAGTYTLTVTDANGCSVSTPVVITQPDVLSITAVATGVQCNGNADGTVTTTVTGGTAPYTYQWSNGATTADLTALAAGLYSATVTDANGCTATVSATVNVANALVINLGITNATCGNSNGAIDASVSGGAAPYTYTWSIAGSGNSLSGLAARSYSLTVVDGNGCSATTTATVSSTSTIAVTPTVTPVVCGSGNTGAISLAATGGSGTLSYAWSNAATTASITGLAAGTYTVTVSDTSACSTVLSIVVEENSPFTITSSATAADCGGANGSATVTVSGGVAPYMYAWSNGATMATATALTGGLYEVTITDANGCTASEFVLVPNTTAIDVTVGKVDNASCGQANGAINITVAGGATPYTYLWSNGATTASLSGLNPGTYAVTVTDANGCSGATYAVVGAAEPVVFVADRDDVNCFNGLDGSIAVSIVSGKGPFTYQWSPAGSGASLTNLGAGAYAVTVTAANGCSATVSITLTQPNQLVATLDSATNVTCNGLANGAINVTTTGGTQPYSFNWGNAGTTEDLSGLAAGTYTLTVTDANGCTSQPLQVTITEPDTLVLSLVSADTLACYGNSNGTATVLATGGTAPYSYDWSNSDTTATATGLVAGTYTVSVSDANGCTSNTITVVIAQPDSMQVMILGSELNCNNESNGEVRVKGVVGGTAPYGYSWSNGAGNVADITGLPAGTYTVTVTDANGCTTTASATLVNPAALVVASNVTNVSCKDAADGSIALTISGGTGAVTVTWSHGPQTDLIDNLVPGSYTVTVTDVKGCEYSETFNITAGNCNNPPIAVNDTVTTTSGTPIDIPVLGNDSDPDGDDINVTGIPTPPTHGTAVINSDGTITYTPDGSFVGVDSFMYVICDNGTPSLCDSAWVIVTVLPERPNVSIPNGFSPDGDGINDNFEIVDITKFPKNKLEIFNRWGNTVYKAQPYNNNWNGSNMDGEPLPDGTYFYVLEINDGTTPPYTGFVVIHRGSNK